MSRKELLDIAAGTGDIVNVITPHNNYTAIDISPGLLRKARKKTIERGFSNPALYVADACQLPFADDSFDVAVCNLSLNFFTGIDDFVMELKRVLKSDAWFYCSMPVPERKNPKAVIHGTLYSVDQLKHKFTKAGFSFKRNHSQYIYIYLTSIS